MNSVSSIQQWYIYDSSHWGILFLLLLFSGILLQLNYLSGLKSSQECAWTFHYKNQVSTTIMWLHLFYHDDIQLNISLSTKGQLLPTYSLYDLPFFLHFCFIKMCMMKFKKKRLTPDPTALHKQSTGSQKLWMARFGWESLRLHWCIKSSLKLHPASIKCLILALMSVRWSNRTLLKAWREPAVSYPQGIVCASKTLNFTLN